MELLAGPSSRDPEDQSIPRGHRLSIGAGWMPQVRRVGSICILNRG